MTNDAQRGQALIETIVFVPLFLVMLYAILYFGQIGVKQERVQTATRFGVNTLPGATLNIEDMYAAYNSYNTTTLTVPLPALTPVACPTSASTQTQLAFNQAQTVPTSAPTAQPYWQMSAPTITCKTTFLPVSNLPDMYDTGMSFVNGTENQITGSVTAAKYLTTFLPSSYAISGSYNGYVPVPLDVMIACTPYGGGGHGSTTGNGLATYVAQALGPGTSSTGAGAVPFYAGYDTTNYSGAQTICNVN